MNILLATGAVKDAADLVVGDQLASPDGAPSSVLALMPRGEVPMIRMTFRDGRSVITSACHVWSIGCKYWLDGKRLMTAADILQWHQKASRYGRTLRVERYAGQFGTENAFLPPYLMGVLIGDGGLTKSPVFTSMDPEIVAAVRDALPDDHYLRDCKDAHSGNAKTYAIVSNNWNNIITRGLRYYGLMGKTSLHKRLPQAVFRWSRPDRLGLLRGIMDTDGCAEKSNCATYSTSSSGLRQDMVRLVRSLGGLAFQHATKKTTHADHYRMVVSLNDPSECFTLPRKKERMTGERGMELNIWCVEQVSPAACCRIVVSHSSGMVGFDQFVFARMD